MRQVKLVDAPGGVAKTFDEHAREPFGLRSAFPDIQPAVRRARLRRAWGIRKIDSNLLEQFGIGFIFLVRITRWLSHRVNAHQESPLLWGKLLDYRSSRPTGSRKMIGELLTILTATSSRGPRDCVIPRRRGALWRLRHARTAPCSCPAPTP